MVIGDTYVNLSAVSLVVFEDASTITVYFAVGDPSASFHTGTTVDQIMKVREILQHPKNPSFERLCDGKEFLNLQWVVRAKSDSAGEIAVSLPNGITRRYGGEDKKTLLMRFM